MIGVARARFTLEMGHLSGAGRRRRGGWLRAMCQAMPGLRDDSLRAQTTLGTALIAAVGRW